MVVDLQSSYTLCIKDDHRSYDYTDEEIKDLFNIPRRSTLMRKHREFQFMMLHGVVYTKERLMKFGFVTDNLCSFCQREPETYLHLFLNCEKVKSLWESIVNDFDVHELRNMNWCDIFCGIRGNSHRLKCVNSLIILMKYTIFKSRNNKKLPIREKIRKIIADVIDAEKKLATRDGKLNVHLQKWEHFNI